MTLKESIGVTLVIVFGLCLWALVALVVAFSVFWMTGQP